MIRKNDIVVDVETAYTVIAVIYLTVYLQKITGIPPNTSVHDMEDIKKNYKIELLKEM